MSYAGPRLDVFPGLKREGSRPSWEIRIRGSQKFEAEAHDVYSWEALLKPSVGDTFSGLC